MVNVSQCLCPQCKSTGIVVRRSKHGIFYGCNDFAKGCNWKATQKQLDKMVVDGLVKELTQEELLQFLMSK